MVKIRLMRMGAKKNPHYRIVVVDARQKRGGSYIESLGHYDPRETGQEPLKIDAERAQYWLGNGAQPTESVVRLFEQQEIEVGAVEAKKLKAYTARVEAASS